MPLPMVPAPTTSTRPIEWGSDVDAVSFDSRTVYSSSFADAFALDCTSQLIEMKRAREIMDLDLVAQILFLVRASGCSDSLH